MAVAEEIDASAAFASAAEAIRPREAIDSVSASSFFIYFTPYVKKFSRAQPWRM
jgi:hypothetical protein